VAVLQQMFEAMSTRFHAAMQMLAPQIGSVVDRCRWNLWKRRGLVGSQATRVRCPSTE